VKNPAIPVAHLAGEGEVVVFLGQAFAVPLDDLTDRNSNN